MVRFPATDRPGRRAAPVPQSPAVSIVRINAIEVPPERADEMQARFAARSGEVSSMPGFEAFELLRPTDGRTTWLVYTRWRSEQDFDAWVESAAFQRGHRQHHERGPVGTGSELWGFDLVQEDRPPA